MNPAHKASLGQQNNKYQLIHSLVIFFLFILPRRILPEELVPALFLPLRFSLLVTALLRFHQVRGASPKDKLITEAEFIFSIVPDGPPTLLHVFFPFCLGKGYAQNKDYYDKGYDGCKDHIKKGLRP